MWYNITDTGERKKIYGFNARHVWTSQKMKPSPDACTMKDSILIKTDGWYIDLPLFNCPVRYRPVKTAMAPNERPQPDCKDRFVTRRSGKGKLGFPLTETTTIIKVDEFTENPAEKVLQCQIVITATGVAGLIKNSWIAKEAVIIDAGTARRSCRFPIPNLSWRTDCRADQPSAQRRIASGASRSGPA